MGLYDGPAKGPGDQGIARKVGRNIPLEFRFRRNLDVPRWIDLLGLMCAVKVEIAFQGAAPTDAQLEVFDTGISYLHPGAILAVLKHHVVESQLMFRVRHDIVGPNTQIIRVRREA